MQWKLQQINRQDLNSNAKTTGGAAVADPFVSVYGVQQHIAYRVEDGSVIDCWFDGTTWQKPQTIPFGQGAPCQKGPSIIVYNGQQHFVVVSGPPNPFDGALPGFPPVGSVWDAWYDGHGWNLQELNLTGKTSALPATYAVLIGDNPGPTFRVGLWNWSNQMHCTYQATPGVVIDVFWTGSGWEQQQIDAVLPELPNGDVPTAPPVEGDPFGCVFRPNAGAGAGQQHIAYRDANGTIWDCWYDPLVGPHRTWKVQTINGANGVMHGNPAVNGPVVWTTQASPNPSGADGAQHFAFVDGSGAVWDTFNDGSWHLVQVNAVAEAPAAAGGLWACSFWDEYQADQSHIVYRAKGTEIWDCWFDYTTNTWASSQVNAGAPESANAVGDPFVWSWAGSDGSQQLHVTWRAENGIIWDAFWDVPPEQPGGRAGP